MAELAIYQQSAAVKPIRDITAELFNDFVTWIDRSEKTTITYLKNLKQFLAWLKYTATNRPERDDIINYRQWLIAEHEAIAFTPETEAGWSYRTDHTGTVLKILCKPNTVKQYLQSVRQFFRWTASEGIYPNIAENIHAPKIRTDEHKKDSLKAAEVLEIEQSIIKHAAESIARATDSLKDTDGRTQRSTEQGKRLYAMYLLAVNAGLRTIELSRANIKDLETKSGKTFLYIWAKGHNEADQKKPIAPEVKAAIEDYLKSRSDGHTGNSPLFVATGNRSKGKRIAPTTISTMLKRALQAAGYDSERLTAHSLRHTAGQNVMELTGNNIYNTQMYMRHTSPHTTEIYLNNDNTEQNAEIAEQLYRKYHGSLNNNGSKAELFQLQQIAKAMTAEQLQQLTKIATALNNSNKAR